MPEQRREGTERRLLALLAETSVHAGTGAQLGAVDLPIQRERHTEWPTIYGSGLKGVLRDHAESAGWPPADIQAVFGPSTDKGGKGEDARHAGAVAISDARLLLFPVRTVGLAFAWITCPLALARFQRDARQAGFSMPAIDVLPTKDKVMVPSTWKDRILLEEFDYETLPSAAIEKLGDWIGVNLLPEHESYGFWKKLASSAIVLVTDDDFRDFVRNATEVVTRVKLDDQTKTVSRAPGGGALWTEENLPADTLLYSFVAGWKPTSVPGASVADAHAAVDHLASLFAESWVIQVGGKETVGRGFVAARIVGGSHA